MLNHILSIQFLSHTLINRKKEIVKCTFVDIKQAFDTVLRSGLWNKLTAKGIKEHFLPILTILKFFLQEKVIFGLQSVTESIEDELMMHMKLLILLYTYDTV